VNGFHRAHGFRTRSKSDSDKDRGVTRSVPLTLLCRAGRMVMKTRKRGILNHIGRIEDDPYAQEMLREIYAMRRRPESEQD
jgi:hypothetical protein